jgi:hypothetical protein
VQCWGYNQTVLPHGWCILLTRESHLCTAKQLASGGTSGEVKRPAKHLDCCQAETVLIQYLCSFGDFVADETGQYGLESINLILRNEVKI